MANIAVLGTLDTKGAEHKFVADYVDQLGHHAILIDVGINRVTADGNRPRLVGDVAFAEAQGVAGAISPVPGGVGQMTIACLLLNALIAARTRAGLPAPDIG